MVRIFEARNGVPWHGTPNYRKNPRGSSMYLVISPGRSPEAFFIDAQTFEPFLRYRPGHESDSLEHLLGRGHEVVPGTPRHNEITASMFPPHLQVPEGL